MDIRKMMENSDKNKKEYRNVTDSLSVDNIHQVNNVMIGALMNYVSPEDFKNALNMASEHIKRVEESRKKNG